MTRLTDALEALELDLEKYPGSTTGDLLNRRLLLRRAFQLWGRERYEEGHQDGSKDVRHTQYRALEIARRTAEDAEAAGVAVVSREDLRAVIAGELPDGVRERFLEALEEAGDDR